MTMTKQKLLAALFLFGLASTMPSLAQDAGSATSVEQVVVSASRITIGGYQQATPVTVLGSADLQRDAQTNIADEIQKLPSVGTSTSPNTSVGSQSVSNGSAGGALVNLRNLGTQRTLVLFDGARVVSYDPSGGVDLNLLPTNLVQRVDIVTGGASAAWGSDAVAGVVNVILDKTFTGWRANFEGGINTPDVSRKTVTAQLSYGDTFAGDRGHFILGGSWLNSPDTVVPQDTSWYNASALVHNPAFTATNGQPALIHANHVGLSTGTQGGLITSGPLKGIQFVGPNATPTQFNFGNVSGSYSNGGSAADPAQIGETDDIAVPIQTYTFMAYASYKIFDDVSASLMLNYGHTDTDNGSASYTRLGNITVTADNAYLPASVKAAMAANAISSFTFGTTNVSNCNGAVDDFNSDNSCLGNLSDHVKRTLKRGVLTFDGAVFSDWSWNVTLQHSENERQTHLTNDPIVANYNLAIDAVTAPAGNAVGIAAGTIVCRSTLTNPTNGCQPLDIFGTGPGVQSAAAIGYISRNNPSYDLLDLGQDTADISLQGQPFSLPAGPVSVVVGADYRKEAVDQTADPLSNARGYAAGNFQNYSAHYHTEEAFGEIELPILKDNLVQSLDFNSAGRVTDYSTSGVVETWKLGLTSQVNDDVRLRATWSADIRAPTLTDLYNPGSSSIQVQSDPFRGNAPTNLTATQGGNPNLKPEQASTISGGVILTPHWVPGLTMSADWYSIDIKGAIYTLQAATELADCFAGQTQYCSTITRDSTGVITQISGVPLNAASQRTSGLDFQANYAEEMFGGMVNLTLLGNYTDEATQVAAGITTDNAGSLGTDAPYSAAGLPKLRTTFDVTYSEGPYSGTVQLRGIGAAKLNNTWGPLNVDDNSVDPVGYIDLRGSYFMDDAHSFQVYGAIDNLLDTPPPNIPVSSAANLGYFYVATRTDIYDALGRTMRLGVRISLN
jgi:iron complex outermembrane recepter protein